MTYFNIIMEMGPGLRVSLDRGEEQGIKLSTTGHKAGGLAMTPQRL